MFSKTSLTSFDYIFRDLWRLCSQMELYRIEVSKTRDSNFVISGIVRQRLQRHSVFSIARWSTYQEIRFVSEATCKSKVAVEVNLPPTVSRPVCLGVRRPSGTFDLFFFLLEIPFRHLRVCYFVAPSLTRGRVCKLLYNCF
jgi:hypothetical protein